MKMCWFTHKSKKKISNEEPGAEPKMAILVLIKFIFKELACLAFGMCRVFFCCNVLAPNLVY